jgi:hypothetical protein
VSDDRPRRPPATREFSDVVGAELAIAVGIWFVVALFCFIVVGVVAGIAAIVVGVIACALLRAAEVRQAELSGRSGRLSRRR